MGSWAGTCGVSHLPITRKTPIRLALIVGHPNKLANDNLVRNPGTWEPDVKEEYIDENGDRHAYYAEGRRVDQELQERKRKNDGWREAWYSCFTYSDDVFFPRCVPLKGKYDDYGGINRLEDSLNVTAVLDQFQLDLDEYPAGNYNIPVKISKDMSLDHLLDAIQQGGVTINRFKDGRPHSRGHHLPVGTWMVREDIFQAVIGAKIPGRWHDESFDIATFYEAGEAYRKGLVERAAKYAEVEELFKHSEGPDSQTAKAYRSLRSMTNHVSENALLRSMRAPPFENGLGFYDDWLVDAVGTKKLDPKSDKTKSFIREIAEFSFFCIAKNIMRVAWMPQCGGGVQDSRIEVHAAVAKQTLKTIELMRAKQAAEEADE